jgi:UDP-glucose 4-epimerase
MSNRGRVLVTGGCGYVGSHVVKQLVEAGEDVVVVDDLSTGFAESLLGGYPVFADCGDSEFMRDVLVDYRVDTVMHLAAKIVVPESVFSPLRYYGANTCTSRRLLEACVSARVERVVFSSTASVYGDVPNGVASEDTPTAPSNPYGRSKLMTEWMLRDAAVAHDLRYVALRYFNVAGADPEARIGQRTKTATHLIKRACEVAAGKSDQLGIFGTDYDTPDGTAVRDYIHVEDIASAHLAALAYLRDGGSSEVLNCGYGRGASVRQVIAAVERAHGAPLRTVNAGRRAGDVPYLVARAQRIVDVLGWEPQHADLDHICRTALAWEHRV